MRLSHSLFLYYWLEIYKSNKYLKFVNYYVIIKNAKFDVG